MMKERGVMTMRVLRRKLRTMMTRRRLKIASYLTCPGARGTGARAGARAGAQVQHLRMKRRVIIMTLQRKM